MKIKKTWLLLFLLLSIKIIQAQQLLADKPGTNTFSIGNTIIYVDATDEPVIKKSAVLLQHDIEMVTGIQPGLENSLSTNSKNIIIIGSIQKSSFIQQLLKQKKITTSIENKWEAYQIQTIKKPFKGIDNALVIFGSDRRGTAFGVFEVAKQIGVSPWYWWADVPVKKKKELFLQQQFIISDAPKVKYRGIFINDEAPALSNWSKATFGGFNHSFYEKVFELMLRLKSNYIWPAMWGNAFYDDDSLNIKAADEYAIVIGTSHHEPLMRAHDEWRRYGKGKWNYDSNEVRFKSILGNWY